MVQTIKINSHDDSLSSGTDNKPGTKLGKWKRELNGVVGGLDEVIVQM